MAHSRPSLFPSQLHAPTRPVDTFGGSGNRVYDYMMKYPPDKPGEENNENARVWNVFLDEMESHDSDMLQGFRDVIDGVLVFAALFSAVVIPLVAQTSQVLQPDNAQITVSLLVETNQLLRAAGNGTSVNSVPTSTLSPGSVVHTSRDVWVSGLFFTSLGLSLSTALFSVLVKQWLHAYSSFITGDARNRAFIINLHSNGLRTWRVREIVEALPLILHSSVLIFFVGLVLYVSQLSTPICVILAFITTLAFIFYVGSSVLPSAFIACPYRISFFFNFCQGIIYYLSSIRKYVVCHILLAPAFIPAGIWNLCKRKEVRWTCQPYKWPLAAKEIMTIKTSPHITLSVLEHLLQISFERSTQRIVLEAFFTYLQDNDKPDERRRALPLPLPPWPFGLFAWHALIEFIFILSLSEFTISDESRDNADGPLGNITSQTWENRIGYLNERIEIDSSKKVSRLLDVYGTADQQNNDHACECILGWIGTPALEDARNASALLKIMKACTGNGIRQILNRTTTVLFRMPEPLLWYLVMVGHLDGVKAVVGADSSDQVVNCISGQKRPLDVALSSLILSSKHDIVNYLMDHHATASPDSYESAFFFGINQCNWAMVKLLWSRRREVRSVDTRPDSWCTRHAIDIAYMPWKGCVLEESRRQELVDILEECDEASVEEGRPFASSHSEPIERPSSLRHPSPNLLTFRQPEEIDDPTT